MFFGFIPFTLGNILKEERGKICSVDMYMSILITGNSINIFKLFKLRGPCHPVAVL